ncbi:hypothetical protein EJ110_NYTH56374 [Nymphaea thermarum]|nr:hypothetical protein EJ110_NYTH56374 [Nymphaea thermarum]
MEFDESALKSSHSPLIPVNSGTRSLLADRGEIIRPLQGFDQHQARAEQGDLQALAEEQECKRKLNQALRMEEAVWKQRLRVKWLAEGDKNTSFFHSMTKFRQAKRHTRVISSGGRDFTDTSHILQVCSDYFKNLLGQDEANGSIFSDIEEGDMVGDYKNESLIQSLCQKPNSTGLS